jgi:hypothetical protein
MAEILALEGKIGEARATFRKARELAPAGSAYQRLLIEREKALGQ